MRPEEILSLEYQRAIVEVLSRMGHFSLSDVRLIEAISRLVTPRYSYGFSHSVFEAATIELVNRGDVCTYYDPMGMWYCNP